ncbi:hypothetical protein [Nostoc phage N1]|nr:hypothetical protein [Nostoc phage N1]
MLLLVQVYTHYQNLVIQNKKELIIDLYQKINIDILSIDDLSILYKAVIKSLFIFKIKQLKKSIIKVLMVFLIDTLKSIKPEDFGSDYIKLDIKLNRIIFLLKLITVKNYKIDSGGVTFTPNNITINDRYKYY